MKNKYTLLFFTFLFINVVLAQQEKLEAHYTFINNVINIETKSILVANSNESIFVTFLEKFSTHKASANYDNNSIRLAGEKINEYNLTNYNNKEHVAYRIETTTIFKITEKLPIFNWNINYSDTKKINKYTCNKATVVFRGREYIAWYSPEIPISSGPWKFYGLPGLILEVTDISNSYAWVVSKFKFPSKKEIIVPYKKFKSVSLEEFVLIEIESMNKLRAKVISVLPRGSSTKRTSKKYRRSIELEYEWEEQN